MAIRWSSYHGGGQKTNTGVDQWIVFAFKNLPNQPIVGSDRSKLCKRAAQTDFGSKTVRNMSKMSTCQNTTCCACWLASIDDLEDSCSTYFNAVATALSGPPIIRYPEMRLSLNCASIEFGWETNWPKVWILSRDILVDKTLLVFSWRALHIKILSYFTSQTGASTGKIIFDSQEDTTANVMYGVFYIQSEIRHKLWRKRQK